MVGGKSPAFQDPPRARLVSVVLGIAFVFGTLGPAPAAVTVIPGVVLSGALDGHLRAYTAEEGKVVWDFDTVREYQTVNGVPASGGALNVPGPVVVNGMIFVNSGYARSGGLAGNVLLAFAPKE